MTRTCPQCERDFTPNAKHHVYDVQECRYQGWVEKEVDAAEAPPQRVEGGVHPLAEARAQQESSDLKSRLSQVIYQGIVDRLRYGPVHADDLEGLFPEERRSMCRRLVGAQFGSLAARGYIVERERRKSKVKSRKGAKSGVYTFTRTGREKLVGNSVGGGQSSHEGAGAVSGEDPGAGVSTPTAVEGALTGGSAHAPAPDPPDPLFDDLPLNPLSDAEAA